MTVNRAAALRLLNDTPFDDPDMGEPVTANLIDPQSVKRPDHPCQIMANEYGVYSVPEAFLKREVPEILSMGGVYEPATLKMMQNMAGSGDIVSGGAFVGDFFPALSRALAPGAILHSFEPNPMAFQSALHTVALNRLHNVSMSLTAVGEHADVLPLQVSRAGNNALAAGAKLVRDQQEGSTIDVTVIPIDMLIPANRDVSVLHLDVEGHEMQAMLGATELVHRCKPVIILEGDRAPVRRMYKRFLRSRFPDLNYQFAGLVEHNMIFVADPY